MLTFVRYLVRLVKIHSRESFVDKECVYIHELTIHDVIYICCIFCWHNQVMPFEQIMLISCMNIYIGKKCTENYSQNLNWENNRETRARKRIILKPILMDQIIWLRTESTSGILWTMWWNRVFFCRRLAERLSASQEWVCKQTRFLEYFESFAICDSYDMPFDVMNCEIWIVC